MFQKKRVELGEKYRNSPLIQLLLFSVWARVMLATIICAIVGVAFVLPKIWTVSPTDFYPKVKISILDKLQASALTRKAEAASDAEKYEESILAWQAAWGNNPCNQAINRGFLNTLLKAPRSEETDGLAIHLTDWLLRLTHTNQADLMLSVQVLDACRFYDLIVGILRPLEAQLSTNLAPAYVKALFYCDQPAAFNKQFNRFSSTLTKDEELMLLKLAYDAGHGSGDSAEQALKNLLKQAQSGGHNNLANQLLIQVAGLKRDQMLCEQALQRLVDEKGDQFRDHLSYWFLLSDLGQKQKSMELAQNSALLPKSSSETVRLATLYLALGSLTNSYECVAWHINHLRIDPLICMFYGGLLMDMKKWPEMLAFATRMRENPYLPQGITAWGYYLEGCAELGLGRREYAEAAINKIPEIEIDDATLGVKIGTQLLLLGYVKPAQKVLAKLEKQFSQDAQYWKMLSLAAGECKDVDNMTKAAKKAYQLETNDHAIINNYAVVLVNTRTEPALALKLTSQIYALAPDNLVTTLNHVEALLLNGRTADAEQILAAIKVDKLNPILEQNYYWNSFQILMLKRDYPAAQKACQRIKADALFPAQKQYLIELQKQLPQS